MKRLALAAIVLSIVACSSQDETPADTGLAAPAAAPAPAVTDSVATPAPDSAVVTPDSTSPDSAQRDTTAR